MIYPSGIFADSQKLLFCEFSVQYVNFLPEKVTPGFEFISEFSISEGWEGMARGIRKNRSGLLLLHEVYFPACHRL